MTDEDDEEEARRRKLIRDAAGSNALTAEQQNFLRTQADILQSGGQPSDADRKTTRLLVGKAASP